MGTHDAYWARIAAGLTDAERAQILNARRRRLSGGRRLTNAEIGAKIGKPGHWVSGVAGALGSRPRKPRPASIDLSAADRELFARLWREGMPTEDIARYWGFGKDWATKWARKLGLPLRFAQIKNVQRAEIRRRVAAGEPRAQVATALGVSRNTVIRHTCDLPHPKPVVRPKVNPGLADRLLRQGYSTRQLAELFGCSRSGVTKAVRLYRKRLAALSARKPEALIPPVRIAA